jgi:hypothetical protein
MLMVSNAQRYSGSTDRSHTSENVSCRPMQLDRGMIMRRGEQKDRGRRRIGSMMTKHRRDKIEIQEGTSSDTEGE